MEFDNNQVDTSGLDDRRGRVNGGAVGAGLGGTGVLGIVALLLFVFLGGDPATIGDPTGTIVSGTNAGTSAPSGSGVGDDLAISCATKQALETRDDCFVLKVYNETTDVWTSYFATQGQKYTPPKLVYYDRSTTTGGCGPASANAGPFYCPADQRVYIDLNFLKALQAQYGFSGRYATAYIVAHEVGHHIQSLNGTEQQIRQLQQRNPSKANAYSVALELQADCYAGVWGRKANDSGKVVIDAQEYDQALTAAAAVGDDTIMAGAGMKVNPEKFTHGTSKQRQESFSRGYSTGDYAACTLG